MDDSIPNLMHTYVRHIVDQLSGVLPKDRSILVTGGGAYNSFLIDQIKSVLACRYLYLLHNWLNTKKP